jgi:hypothetical protein
LEVENVDIPCEDERNGWGKVRGMGMIRWWGKIGLLWSIEAILTSNSSMMPIIVLGTMKMQGLPFPMTLEPHHLVETLNLHHT